MFEKKKTEKELVGKLRPISIYRAKCIKKGNKAPPFSSSDEAARKGDRPCGWYYFTSLEDLSVTDADNSGVPCVQCGGELVGLNEDILTTFS